MSPTAAALAGFVGILTISHLAFGQCSDPVRSCQLAIEAGGRAYTQQMLAEIEACTAPEDLMPAAMEMAATIASKSPVSTRMGKHTLNVIEDMSLRDGYRYEQDMTAIIGKTEDAKEAQLAFKEKRAPSFKGR